MAKFSIGKGLSIDYNNNSVELIFETEDGHRASIRFLNRKMYILIDDEEYIVFPE